MTDGSITHEADRVVDPATLNQPPLRALVLEPEELVRWSVVTYLAKWYEVVTADTRDAALLVLEHDFDALVVSDDLSRQSADRIVAHARARNPDVRIVRLAADPPAESDGDRRTSYLEKPFDLATLATLLRVPESSCSAASARATA